MWLNLDYRLFSRLHDGHELRLKFQSLLLSSIAFYWLGFSILLHGFRLHRLLNDLGHDVTIIVLKSTCIDVSPEYRVIVLFLECLHSLLLRPPVLGALPKIELLPSIILFLPLLLLLLLITPLLA